MAWMEPHRDAVLTSQQMILEEESFTDLDVILSDGSVRACRVIVASLSRTFYCMLNTDMKERSEGLLKLELVSKNDWRCILNFYLSGKKLVIPESAEDLLAIAHLYQLDALVEHCGSVLMESLTIDNCFDRLATSKIYMPSASSKIVDFMQKNFIRVSQMAELCSLAKGDILDILGSCGVIATEDIVCDAVLKWLSEKANNEDEVKEVLNLVKFNEISSTYVYPMPPSQASSGLIEKVMRDVASRDLRRRTLSQSRNDKILPGRRSAKGGDKDIVLLGHGQDNSAQVLCTWEGSHTWRKIPAVHFGFGSAAHMVGDTIFVTGGKGTEKALYKLGVRNMEWSKGPDMVTNRTYHAMTSVENRLFVLGGCDKDNYTESIQKHDIGQDIWEEVGKLQLSAISPGVAAIGNVIVVVGGTMNKTDIQTFNVVTGMCLCISTFLPGPMFSATGASLGNEVVFVGNKGDVVHMNRSDGGISIVRHYRLPAFTFRRFFGLVIDGDHMFCCGDEPYQQKSFGISRYGLNDGHEDPGILPALPLLFNVVGAFATRVSVL